MTADHSPTKQETGWRVRAKDREPLTVPLVQNTAQLTEESGKHRKLQTESEKEGRAAQSLGRGTKA